MKIDVHASEDLGNHPKVSSAPSYDAALSLILPYFCFVSIEDGSDLATQIADGEEDAKGYVSFPSFALMWDYQTDGKILWLSASALSLLSDTHEVSMMPSGSLTSTLRTDSL